MHLVDHEVVLVLHLEVLMLPRILRSVDLESGNELLCACRERWNALDVLVVPLVVYDLCVRVAEVCVIACSIAETILETVLLVRVKAIKGDPPAVLRTVKVHGTLSNSFPIVPVTYDVAVLVALTCSVLIIYYECNAAVSIVVDAVVHAFRKFLGHKRIRNELLCLILVILDCAELVSLVTLCISVSSSYNKGDLGHRSLATAEVLADRRLHPELPVVISNLCEVGLLLSCAPFSRNKLPITVHNDSEVAVELACMAIERVACLRLEDDRTWLVSVWICRVH